MGKTDYKGIDWGNGITNIDKENNIRYGVIHQNEVLQAWADSSEALYENYCPDCETLLDGNLVCYNCDREFEPEDFDNLDPSYFYYENDGYYCQQNYDDPDIFILKSPYYTYSQFCSPCAPGAGYIMNELEIPDENNKTYCFGHDWFDDIPNGTKQCSRCSGKGLIAKSDIPNFSEERFKSITRNNDFVECWVCNGAGNVINYIRKAPYKVFSVKTNREVFPERG